MPEVPNMRTVCFRALMANMTPLDTASPVHNTRPLEANQDSVTLAWQAVKTHQLFDWASWLAAQYCSTGLCSLPSANASGVRQALP